MSLQRDALAEKLRDESFADFFPAYKGDNSEADVLTFISDL